LYLRRGRDELEGRFVGLMAYPDPRGERDDRMPGKRRSAQVSGRRCRGTRVIWRKLDCLKPISRRCKGPSAGKTPDTGATLCDGLVVRPSQPSGRGALPDEGNQGDEWDAYVTLDTYDRDERGIDPRGASLGGDGVPVVVVGATTHQGGRESRPQGEGAQVAGHRRAARYA
jgi:hypothetical protein